MKIKKALASSSMADNFLIAMLKKKGIFSISPVPRVEENVKILEKERAPNNPEFVPI